MFSPAAPPHPEQHCPASCPLMRPGQKSVLLLSHRQGLAAESKKSTARENESRDEKVWGICWRGQKELCTEKTGEKKRLRGEKES